MSDTVTYFINSGVWSNGAFGPSNSCSFHKSKENTQVWGIFQNNSTDLSLMDHHGDGYDYTVQRVRWKVFHTSRMLPWKAVYQAEINTIFLWLFMMCVHVCVLYMCVFVFMCVWFSVGVHFAYYANNKKMVLSLCVILLYQLFSWPKVYHI